MSLISVKAGQAQTSAGFQKPQVMRLVGELKCQPSPKVAGIGALSQFRHKFSKTKSDHHRCAATFLLLLKMPRHTSSWDELDEAVSLAEWMPAWTAPLARLPSLVSPHPPSQTLILATGAFPGCLEGLVAGCSVGPVRTLTPVCCSRNVSSGWSRCSSAGSPSRLEERSPSPAKVPTLPPPAPTPHSPSLPLSPSIWVHQFGGPREALFLALPHSRVDRLFSS